MPRGTKGLLEWKWAERRLTQSHNYWLTTTRPDARPHTMLVWGIWAEGCFFFSTATDFSLSKLFRMRRVEGPVFCSSE